MQGNCPPIHLRLGHEYLVMLGKSSGRYYATYVPEPYNYISINDIIGFCGIDVKPPMGKQFVFQKSSPQRGSKVI